MGMKMTTKRNIIYGPEEAFFDKTWVLEDFEKVVDVGWRAKLQALHVG
jgi:hypothetical protein